MNKTFFRLTRSALCFLATAGLLSGTVRADDYGYGNFFGSGTGTWQDGGGTPWGDFQTNTANLPWNNTLQNDAVFYNPVNDTVIGTVDTTYLYFVNPTNSYTIQGGTIDKTGYNLILENAGANDNVTIDSNIAVDTAGNTDRFNIIGDGANSTTDIEGTLSFYDSAPSATTYRSLIFNSNAPGQTYILNGINTSGTTKAINIRFNEGNNGASTLILKGDYSTMTGGDLVDLAGGTVIIDTSLLPTGKGINSYNGVNDPTAVHTVLLEGARTFTGDVNISNRTDSSFGFVTVGGNTADESTYTGNNSIDNTDFHVTAAAGGRVNFDGTMYGNIPDGLVKTGLGTVVISGANTYNAVNFVTSTASPLAADLQAGTTLINNPNQSGTSAFGNNNGVVQVEAGATLGGTGFATQTVVAVAANSVLTAGDPGQHIAGTTVPASDIAPSIGYLTLGGLTASSGLTMDFKLNGDSTSPPTLGVNNDFIQMGDLTLAGVVTVNLTALDALLTGPGNVYNLFDADGDVSGTPTFNVVAPTGYELDSTYGLDDGLNDGKQLGYDYEGGLFTVKLVATPEPSTYALMGLGLLSLVAILRRAKFSAQAI